jgi:hypothetical protein
MIKSVCLILEFQEDAGLGEWCWTDIETVAGIVSFIVNLSSKSG